LELLIFAAGAIFLCPDTRDLRILGVQGEASRIRHDEHSAPCSTGALFRLWTRQVSRLQGDPGAACQRRGQDAINAEGAHRLSVGWIGSASFS
jgi:hypothetical protein